IPRLQGVLERSAFTVAVRYTMLPAWPFQWPSRPTDSHTGDTSRDWACASGGGNVCEGLPSTAIKARAPLVGWANALLQLVPCRQYVSLALVLRSKIWRSYPSFSTGMVDVAVRITGFPGPTAIVETARLTASHFAFSRLEAMAEPLAGNCEVGGVMNAANVWMPDLAE